VDSQISQAPDRVTRIGGYLKFSATCYRMASAEPAAFIRPSCRLGSMRDKEIGVNTERQYQANQDAEDRDLTPVKIVQMLHDFRTKRAQHDFWVMRSM